VSGSTFGKLFSVTTFGESHGGAVGAVVEGITPGLEIAEAEIQAELNRRKPGQSDLTTPRRESDTVRILSGWFEGRATGTPMLLILYNEDQRPSAYDAIRDKFRPGHADYTYLKKYGIRDYRGSGRASGRETAARAAAGAIAKKMLGLRGISILAYTKRAAGVLCPAFDPDEIERNPMRACDAAAAAEMARRIRRLSEEHDSAGGIVECRVTGVPAGLGEPVFDKLDADLAKAMLSLGAVKGFEIGAGFACADMTGSEHNDWMDAEGFVTNHAGGVLGGISSGSPILFRIAVKPTSSIEKPQRTVTVDGEETSISTEGRHDPCICPRIVPVVEAMAALVLIDHLKRQEADLALR
jgi:chorismate synthase